MRSLAEGELLLARLQAVDAWNRANGAALCPNESVSMSRELRLDQKRRRDVLREQHQALIDRADAHLRASANAHSPRRATRAVVVHRNEWFKDKVCVALAGQGIEVVARLSNGAHAIGCAVAEQPDLLLIEDLLPMVPGGEVVRQVRSYSPNTRIGAQVEHDGRVATILDAGAHAAWSRRVPPADVTQGLLALCHEPLQIAPQAGEPVLVAR